jgi:hypothetical protein
LARHGYVLHLVSYHSCTFDSGNNLQVLVMEELLGLTLEQMCLGGNQSSSKNYSTALD